MIHCVKVYRRLSALMTGVGHNLLIQNIFPQQTWHHHFPDGGIEDFATTDINIRDNNHLLHSSCYFVHSWRAVYEPGTVLETSLTGIFFVLARLRNIGASLHQDRQQLLLSWRSTLRKSQRDRSANSLDQQKEFLHHSHIAWIFPLLCLTKAC